MKTKIIVQDNSWIEGEALSQIEFVSKLQGISEVIGLPDLHPGKGYPIGIVAISDILHPYLIGSDIGCGMAVYKTGVKKHQIKIDKTIKKLERLESFDIQEIIEKFKEKYSHEDLSSLGTIGSGNHFFELQYVEEISDTLSAEEINLIKNEILFLVHTGSRGLGQSILDWYLTKNNHNPILDKDLEEDYLKKHNYALQWANDNREIIANNAAQLLGYDIEKMLENIHNFVEKENDKFIHRKGAAKVNNKFAIIPGSRGSYSYIVKVKDNKITYNSLAHGAGRRWKRSECKQKLKDKYKYEELFKTKLGSFVICNDKELMYEEAPEAYKNIESVIEDLSHFNIVEVVAKLRPIATYKKF